MLYYVKDVLDLPRGYVDIEHSYVKIQWHLLTLSETYRSFKKCLENKIFEFYAGFILLDTPPVMEEWRNLVC